MDYNNLKILLHKYYAGETSLEEEAEIKKLLQKEKVPSEWKAEKYLFDLFDKNRNESDPPESLNTELLETVNAKWKDATIRKFEKTVKWSISIAAGIIIIFGIYLFYNNQSSGIVDTYQDEQQAYLTTKHVLYYISETMNAESTKLSGITYIEKGLSSFDNLSKINTTIENLKTEKK